MKSKVIVGILSLLFVAIGCADKKDSDSKDGLKTSISKTFVCSLVYKWPNGAPVNEHLYDSRNALNLPGGVRHVVAASSEAAIGVFMDWIEHHDKFHAFSYRIGSYDGVVVREVHSIIASDGGFVRAIKAYVPNSKNGMDVLDEVDVDIRAKCTEIEIRS